MKSYLPKFVKLLAEAETEEEKALYAKYIMNFRDPRTIDLRVGQEIDNMQEFDLVDNHSPENYVNGHLRKRFIQLNSDYFLDYFKEVKKGGSYESYIDDIENHPKYLSALIKQAPLDQQYMCEIFAPRIFNEFRVPVVFNTTCKDSDGEEYVVSLDFIKPNERLFLLDEACGNSQFGVELTLKESLEDFNAFVDYCSDKHQCTQTRKQKIDLEKQFIRSYLLRILLLADWDFSTKNVGLLINEKTGQMRLAPNFDLEYCFMSEFPVEEDLMFAYEKYPEIVEKFCKKVEQFSKGKLFAKSKFETMLEKYSSIDYHRGVKDIYGKQSARIIKASENMKIKN